LLLPVRGGWIAGLVAAACGAIALGLVAVGGRGDQLPPATLAVGPALEKVGAADQVAHGLARAALVLGGFALGLWLGGLVSALRA
jgi:hypothetical protein